MHDRTCAHALELARVRAELDQAYAALAACNGRDPDPDVDGIRHERAVLYRALVLANGHATPRQLGFDNEEN